MIKGWTEGLQLMKKGSKANKAAQSALLSLFGSLGDASELQAFLTSAQPCEEHESGVPGGSDE